MKRKLKLCVVAAFIIFCAILGVSRKDAQSPVKSPSIFDVEASAACETSSSSSLNYGHCVQDVNNKQEYCASGKGTPECNATI